MLPFSLWCTDGESQEFHAVPTQWLRITKVQKRQGDVIIHSTKVNITGAAQKSKILMIPFKWCKSKLLNYLTYHFVTLYEAVFLHHKYEHEEKLEFILISRHFSAFFTSVFSAYASTSQTALLYLIARFWKFQFVYVGARNRMLGK